jgi:hypothetical protein
MLGSGAFLPIHWGTFNLAMHPWDEPAETVLRAAPAAGIQLILPRLGQPVEPARGPLLDPWWREVSPAGAAEPAEVEEGERTLEWAPD